jgi:hypothetical protein
MTEAAAKIRTNGIRNRFAGKPACVQPTFRAGAVYAVIGTKMGSLNDRSNCRER